jgi:hypothetical protein
MNTGRTLLLLAVGFFRFGSGLLADDDSFAPQVHGPERYRQIWEKSPFIAAAPISATSGGLADRFVLTGMASLLNRPVIFVLDRKGLSRQMVTKEPNFEGVVLVSVEEKTDPKESRATIRLGSEQAVIRYDLAALQGVNQNTEGAPGGNPAAPTQTSTVSNQAQAGANPVPRPIRVFRRPSPIKLTN